MPQYNARPIARKFEGQTQVFNDANNWISLKLEPGVRGIALIHDNNNGTWTLTGSVTLIQDPFNASSTSRKNIKFLNAPDGYLFNNFINSSVRTLFLYSNPTDSDYDGAAAYKKITVGDGSGLFIDTWPYGDQSNTIVFNYFFNRSPSPIIDGTGAPSNPAVYDPMTITMKAK